MKKFAIIFCFLTVTFTIMQAQDSTKLIYMEKVFGGYTFLFIPFTIIAVILVSGIFYFRKESKYFAENI